MEQEKTEYTKQIFYLLIFFAVILFLTILKITSSFMIPITFAIILACVLHPVIEALVRVHIPRPLAIILVSALLIFVIFFGGAILINSFRAILNNYPAYEAKFLTIYEYFADRFNLAFDADKSFFDNLWTGMNELFNFRGYVQRIAVSLSSGVYAFSRSLFIVMLLMIFLLTEINMMAEKIKKAFENKMENRVGKITGTIVKEVTHFLFIKFYVSLGTGILVYIGLKIIGLDFAIIWAAAAFILNFIPTFGSIISALVTTVFASIQFFSLTHPQENGKIIAVFLLMTCVNFLIGNIVEPKIEGDNLGLSPFVIVASLSIWGWIWGFVGMILAVPFMVFIKIVCDNVSYLKPIAVILGSRPQKEETTAN